MSLCPFNGGQCVCQPQDGIACPHIPRYVATDAPEIMQESPIGAWVRWDDVQRVILNPLKDTSGDQQ